MIEYKIGFLSSLQYQSHYEDLGLICWPSGAGDSCSFMLLLSHPKFMSSIMYSKVVPLAPATIPNNVDKGKENEGMGICI